MLNIGIIGYGYWGPNLVRNFNSVKGSKVVCVCDIDHFAVARVRRTDSKIEIFSDYRDMLNSGNIDAVGIATPVFTHFELAKRALANGKHIFIEKPFTSKQSEAEELIDIAESKNLKIMVDHTFLFTGAVRKIKEIINDDIIGNVYYFDSTRVNLGLFQHDVNVIWDLAPHDFSIMDYLLKEKPMAISATGLDHFGRNLENTAYITVFFDSNMIAHFNVNWLSPVKIRTTLIGGSKKMIVWNDLESDEKIKIYDKGVELANKEGVYKLMVEYRSGDMLSPKIDHTEALKVEIEYFVECILNDIEPINDACAGLRVVRMLEASEESIKNRGKLIRL